jgi:hypothetical protein
MHEQIDQEGNIKENYVPHITLMPQSFQSFAEQVSRELSDYSRRTVSVLRWCCDWNGPHDPISSRGLYWSYDGNKWKMMPGGLKVYMEVGAIGGAVSEEICGEIESLVKEGASEPIGHELFREAWEQRHQNSRSSLVIGIAAAEVGFKQFVINLEPKTSWLIEEVPSPPLIRMLEDYLPRLPTRNKIQGHVPTPPPEILKPLREGIAARNKLAHVKPPALAHEKLEEILLAVKDLLWILDYYDGFDWALNRVRPETRRILIANE